MVGQKKCFGEIFQYKKQIADMLEKRQSKSSKQKGGVWEGWGQYVRPPHLVVKGNLTIPLILQYTCHRWILKSSYYGQIGHRMSSQRLHGRAKTKVYMLWSSMCLLKSECARSARLDVASVLTCDFNSVFWTIDMTLTHLHIFYSIVCTIIGQSGCTMFAFYGGSALLLWTSVSVRF